MDVTCLQTAQQNRDFTVSVQEGRMPRRAMLPCLIGKCYVAGNGLCY